MKRIFGILTLALLILPLSAQEITRAMPAVRGVIVEYAIFESGEPAPLSATLNANWEYAKVESDQSETLILDYSADKYYSTAEFMGRELAVSHNLNLNRGVELISQDSEKLFSWDVSIYRSLDGRVEIWATQNLGPHGTPAPEYGVVDGIVLRVVVDGVTIIDATSLERSIMPVEVTPPSELKIVSQSTFNSAVICNEIVNSMR